jgi:hypothetical protein
MFYLLFRLECDGGAREYRITALSRYPTTIMRIVFKNGSFYSILLHLI